MRNEVKDELRQQCKSFIKTLSLNERSKLDLEILKNLNNLLNQFQFSYLGIYFALNDEPSLLEHINSDVKLVFPYYDNQSFEMNYYDLKDRTLGNLNHAFTLNGSEIRVIPEVLIAPALGFNHSGYRLGRGKGFFDRYLKEYNGLKIGVCYSGNLVDFIPETHDEVFDFIITDRKIIRIKKWINQ